MGTIKFYNQNSKFPRFPSATKNRLLPIVVTGEPARTTCNQNFHDG
jgi:hypothetical protein